MKKQNTLVSILIINYNNEKFVSRAINSCLTQNYKNIEILIHDDKSMDDSITQINKFKKNQEGKGTAYRVNLFVKKIQKNY